jgi:hypothetical protein
MEKPRVMAAVRTALSEVQANFGDDAIWYLLPAVETYLVEAGVKIDIDSSDLEVAIEEGEYPENTVAVIDGCVVTIDLATNRIEIVDK